MRIRYFKDESDFKTTQFLTDEKTPQCPSLKKVKQYMTGRYTSDYTYRTEI